MATLESGLVFSINNQQSLIDNRLTLLLRSERAVILIHEPAVLLRNALRGAGVQAVGGLLAAQPLRGVVLRAFEGGRQLHLQLIPLREILFPGLGAGRRPPRVELVGRWRLVLDRATHVVEQVARAVPRGVVAIARRWPLGAPPLLPTGLLSVTFLRPVALRQI